MIRPRLLITPKVFPPPSSRKDHYLIVVVVVLLMAASWELGTGLYIYAKAQAAVSYTHLTLPTILLV